MRIRWSIPAAFAAAAVLCSVHEAGAATLGFDVTGKGVSETVAGDKFKFTGAGTMTVDDVAGTLDFSMLLSNGLTFSGSSQAAITGKGKIFALVPVGSGGISGQAIFTGKASKDRSKFNGKLLVAIPNRIGPAPGGFVVTKMTVKGTLQ